MTRWPSRSVKRARARRWKFVAPLARELEARRLARAGNVVDLAETSDAGCESVAGTRNDLVLLRRLLDIDASGLR